MSNSIIIMMKTLVASLLLMSLASAEPVSTQETKTKSSTKSSSTVQTTPKQSAVYSYQQIDFNPQSGQSTNQPQQYIVRQQDQHHQHQLIPQLIPVRIIQKPIYAQQPHAMIIIAAQPVLPHQHLGYASATQQLLNYFHNNPQAKYQLLHGDQPVIPQHVIAQQPQPVAQQSLAQYQILSSSQLQQPTVVFAQTPQHHAQPSSQPPQPIASPLTANPQQIFKYYHQQQQPQSEQFAGHLAQLAQLAAQHYASSPLKSAPAIVTGFENFTPEQQASIKEQLAKHLGTPVSVASSGNNHPYSSRYNTEYFNPSKQVKIDIENSIREQRGGEALKVHYKG